MPQRSSTAISSLTFVRLITSCVLWIVTATSADAASQCLEYQVSRASGVPSGWLPKPADALNTFVASCNANPSATLACAGGYGCSQSQVAAGTCTQSAAGIDLAVGSGWPSYLFTWQVNFQPTGFGVQTYSFVAQSVQKRANPNGCQIFVSVEPGECPTCNRNTVGDPIDPANGAVYVSEVDTTASASGLSFKRTYNSRNSLTSITGKNTWQTSFSRRVQPVSSGSDYKPYAISPDNSSLFNDEQSACLNGFNEIKARVSAWANATASYVNSTCLVSVGTNVITRLRLNYMSPPTPDPATVALIGYEAIRDDGQHVRFGLNGSTIVGLPGTTLRMQLAGAGYTVTDANDTVEQYDSNGVLQSITTRSGNTQTLNYVNNRLTTVTDSFGQVIGLGYDAQNRLASVTDTNLQPTTYGYDAAGRLSLVTYPDSSTKTYLYENGTFPNLLTGKDENGVRFSTWGYDTQGRATSTYEAGGADALSLVYNTNGSVAVTDALGAVRTFSYIRVGDRDFPASISGSQCPTCREGKATTYDSLGIVASRTDYNNVVTQYSNNARGLEVSRTEAFGTPKARTITTQWHANFSVPTQIDEPGKRTTFTHDAKGNVLTKTELDTAASTSRTSTYTYNNFGQVLTVDGPRTDVNDVTTYTYYACTTGYQCGQVATVTNAIGQVNQFLTYNANGQPLTMLDANNVLTTLTYDTRQRLKSRSTNGEVLSIDYWPTGLLAKVTLPDSSFVAYTYDTAHRLTQIQDSEGNKIVYTLDAMGNRTKDQAFDPSNALTQTRSRVFNQLSQLYQEIGAANTAAVTTTLGYDANGNATTVNAPLGRNSISAYDELNRLTQVTDPANGLTQYGYNALDQLISVTDPRNLQTSYTYTALGDLTQQISPDTGTTINTYDSGGNLKTSKDARNKTSIYTYDAANRATQVAYGDLTVTYGYDSGTNGIGRLTSSSDANHSLSWTYDTQGRVLSKTQILGTVVKTLSYGYTNGHLTSLTTPYGAVIGYGYTNGKVTGMTVNGTNLLSNVLYEPFGPTSGWTWGNGTLAARIYDTDGKLTQLDSAGLNTYGYDDAFRITAITDTTTAANSWAYGYDPLDRLNSASKTGTTQGFSYDADSNRLTQSGTASTTFTYPATSNKLASTTGSLARTYVYDASGNATTGGAIVYTYYNNGRMKTAKNGSAAAVTYTYNAFGQRVKKTGTTRFFVYDEAGHLQGEYNSSGTMVQEFVWLGDIPVAVLTPNGAGVNIFYIHTDHLNTPRKITRPSDNKLRWTWNPDPFGNGAPNENPQALGVFNFNLRFPGQYADSETGLFYNYFRYFDPVAGRYITSDPIGLGGGINTYAYARGNPLTFSDPLGLNPYQPSPVTALEEAILSGDVARVEALLEAAAADIDSAGALARAAANANKINHLFGKQMHNLDKLVKACGSEGKAFQEILKAGAKDFPKIKDGVVQDISVTINGVAVTVRGILVNGQFELSTAFIP
jgi:RHS repeat-associated protein